VAWDTLGVPTYRHELWPSYQGGREFDAEILTQLDVLPDLCAAFGFGVGKAAGFEADDLMAAAAMAETTRGGRCLLLTTDRDAYQLVSEDVTVLAPRRGVRELERIGPHEVVERLGVLPEQVPDFKALSGDSSDRIPGIRGIGPKSAAGLLLRYGTLEGVIAAWGRAADDAALARRFQDVVRMRPTVAITLPASGPPDWERGAAKLLELGAERTAERMLAIRDELAAPTQPDMFEGGE
jgi:DNA polymerase-1